MKARGYVAREANPRDRREVMVRVTEKAEALTAAETYAPPMASRAQEAMYGFRADRTPLAQPAQ